MIIVRDMNVIAPDKDILEKLDDAFPLIIGAEDLYYTKEDFSLETFQFVDDASAENDQQQVERNEGQQRKGRDGPSQYAV